MSALPPKADIWLAFQTAHYYGNPALLSASTKRSMTSGPPNGFSRYLTHDIPGAWAKRSSKASRASSCRPSLVNTAVKRANLLKAALDADARVGRFQHYHFADFFSSNCEINPSLPQTHAAILVQIAAVVLSMDRASKFTRQIYATHNRQALETDLDLSGLVRK